MCLWAGPANDARFGVVAVIGTRCFCPFRPFGTVFFNVLSELVSLGYLASKLLHRYVSASEFVSACSAVGVSSLVLAALLVSNVLPFGGDELLSVSTLFRHTIYHDTNLARSNST